MVTSIDLVHEIMDGILDANQLIKRHAEERHVLLKKLIKICDQEQADLESFEGDHEDLVKIVSNLESQIGNNESSEFLKTTKLTYLNSRISELDEKERRRETLIDELMQLDANLLSRDELLDILHEYIEMEQASIHKMVAEYSELQDAMKDMREQSGLFDLLSKNDPRFKALEIINDHPSGISRTQLSFMLGTTLYQAKKIINELIEMDLIKQKDNSQLLQVATPVKGIDHELVALS